MSMTASTVTLARDGARSFEAISRSPRGAARAGDPGAVGHVRAERADPRRGRSLRQPGPRGAGAQPVLALGHSRRDLLRRSAARHGLGAAQGARPRCRLGRHARRDGLAARAAVRQRQGRGDRLLRRRAVCVSRRGALRRRCGRVALRPRHLAASRRDRQRARPAATALRAEGPAHPARRRSTRSRPACAGGRMSKCSSIRRPGTRSPIRCGRPTTRPRRSSPASGSRRCCKSI